jgi:uncharacterized protein with GYD domain
MPKYLFRSRYTPEGAKGLLREGGTGRRAAAQRTIESLGGRIESFYYALGGTDLFTIAELPDNASAAAINLVIAATGTIDSETVVLLTPEEIDEAAGKQPDFRPPEA